LKPKKETKERSQLKEKKTQTKRNSKQGAKREQNHPLLEITTKDTSP